MKNTKRAIVSLIALCLLLSSCGKMRDFSDVVSHAPVQIADVGVNNEQSMLSEVVSVSSGEETSTTAEPASNSDRFRPVQHQVFYAKITSVSGSLLAVEGLEINDINYRGRFWLTVDQYTELEWRSTRITMDDLDPGDLIAVYFHGAVLETGPAQIRWVDRIALLDDEK